jgi:hypothetical protein
MMSQQCFAFFQLCNFVCGWQGCNHSFFVSPEQEQRLSELIWTYGKEIVDRFLLNEDTTANTGFLL